MTSFAPLGEVAQFINGRAFKPSDWGSSGLPIIRIQNLTNPNAPFNYYDKEAEQKYYVQNGDLLISWSATLDAFIWDRGPAILNQHIFRAVPDTSKITKKFLYYAVTHIMDELRAQTHGVTMKHITRKPFEATKIYLPPLAEQERIVCLLDEAEALRKLRAQAKTRMEEFVPALFHEMFGDPVTNPRGWRTEKLGGLLSSIDSGGSPVCLPRGAEENEWGVLKLSGVTSCEYIDQENKALPPEIPPRLGHEIKQGDILFSRKNTFDLVAACAFVFETRPKLILSDLIFRLNISDKNILVPEYLWSTLIYPTKRKEIQRHASGTAANMPNISKEKLKNITIALPPFALQRQFTERVQEAREIQSRQAQSAERIEALYQSMLSRAFTGEL